MEVLASFVVVLGLDGRRACGAHRGSALLAVPAPGIAEPQGGQQLELRRLGPPVRHLDADAEVLCIRLRVFHEDVEVAVALEDPGVEQLVLAARAAAAPVLLA